MNRSTERLAVYCRFTGPASGPMTDIWEQVKKKPDLDAEIRKEIVESFGKKGTSALDAIDTGRVKKYLDFIVVEGKTSFYIVEDDFCTCGNFLYRGRACWHLLAVRIAREPGQIVSIDVWYQETMTAGGEVIFFTIAFFLSQ